MQTTLWTLRYTRMPLQKLIYPLTCCRNTELYVTGVSHCSSNLKVSSSPEPAELWRRWNYLLLWGPIQSLGSTLLQLMGACFNPPPVHHLWVTPLLLALHRSIPPPPSIAPSLSLSCSLLYVAKCCWLTLTESVAVVSCTTVSMATAWQCHLAMGHVTAQPSGKHQ